MEPIKEIFKNKNFSQEALLYLENAIDEFDDLFGGYVSKEELLTRIKNNVNKIEFVDEVDPDSPCIVGSYNPKDKTIKIKKRSNEEYIKSTFFHELLHAIVVNKLLNSGFVNSCFSQYDNCTIYYGTGWNEGFVQMLTRIRDKKYAKGETVNAYPILTDTVEKFSELFGKNELIDMYLTRAGDFLSFLAKKGISPNFLTNFDIIHKYEKTLFNRHSDIIKTLVSFFGNNPFDPEEFSASLKYAQFEILQTYIDELLKSNVSNISDLLTKTNDMHKVFGKRVDVETFEKLVLAVTPELINQDQNQFTNPIEKLLIHSVFRYEEYKKLGNREKLVDINNFFRFLNDDIEIFNINRSLEKEYYSKSVEELYDGIPDYCNIDFNLFLSSFKGVSQYIINNNLPFEEIKIVYNEYRYGKSYDIFRIQKDGSYSQLTTLLQHNNIGSDVQECVPVDDEKKTELIQRYDDIAHLGNVSDIVSGGNGIYIVNGLNSYLESFQVIINENNHCIETPDYEPLTLPCLNELKERSKIAVEKYKSFSPIDLTEAIVGTEKQLQERQSRLLELKKINAPLFVASKEVEMVNNSKETLFDLKLARKARIREKNVAIAKSKKIVYTPLDIKALLVKYGLIPDSIDQILIDSEIIEDYDPSPLY